MTWRPNDGLPMPVTGRRGPLGRPEWDEYREAQRVHRAGQPDYDRDWQRPTIRTTERAWKLIPVSTQRRLLALPPKLKLTADEQREVEQALRQASVVAINTILTTGKRHTMLVNNVIFEPLALGWSDWYRQAIETGPATTSYDMKLEIARDAFRDLLRNGIDLDKLGPVLRRGVPGLYRIKQQRGHGARVVLSARAAEFQDVMAVYDKEQARLLLADQRPPAHRVNQEVAGGVAYNVVEVGDRRRKLLGLLEAARPYVVVSEFLKDVAELEHTSDRLRNEIQAAYHVDPDLSTQARGGLWSPRKRAIWQQSKRQRKAKRRDWWRRVKTALAEYDSVLGQFRQVDRVRDEVRAHLASGRIALDDLVKIRSGFAVAVNRRIHPTNFWPVEVTAKPGTARAETIEVLGVEEADDEVAVVETTRRRGRWFRADAISSRNERTRRAEIAASSDSEISPEEQGDIQPFFALDVSGSQMQILSVLTADRKNEDRLANDSFKVISTRIATRLDADPQAGFKFPEGTYVGEQREEAVKRAGMLAPYNNMNVKAIAEELWDDPVAYGPGLGTPKNIMALLPHLPGIKSASKTIMPICQMIAARAPAAGVTLTDPYDHAPVRWSPVEREMRPVYRGKFKIYVNAPAALSKMGEHPVDRKALGRTLMPSLVHMMDAAFAGIVVEGLVKQKVRDVILVHDCWLVAEEAKGLLAEVISEAGEPWFRSLGIVYNDLLRLTRGTKYERTVRGWQAVWQRRVKQHDWPKFRVKSEGLFTREVR